MLILAAASFSANAGPIPLDLLNLVAHCLTPFCSYVGNGVLRAMSPSLLERFLRLYEIYTAQPVRLLRRGTDRHRILGDQRSKMS